MADDYWFFEQINVRIGSKLNSKDTFAEIEADLATVESSINGMRDSGRQYERELLTESDPTRREVLKRALDRIQQSPSLDRLKTERQALLNRIAPLRQEADELRALMQEIERYQQSAQKIFEEAQERLRRARGERDFYVQKLEAIQRRLDEVGTPCRSQARSIDLMAS